jgi:ribonuclease HI
VVDPQPLPDDTCAPAEEVKREDRQPRDDGNGATRARAKRAASTREHPTTPAPNTALAYSDGACSGNPGPAGLGVVIVTESERIELSEYLGTATNNIAELTAVLRAIEAIRPAIPTVIYTDSSYAIGVLQKGWKAKANVELVDRLRREIGKRDVELHYVPGHAGVELNERADELARLAIETRASGRVVRSLRPDEALPTKASR